MKVSVVQADLKPNKPVPKALVSLTYLDGTTLMTASGVKGTGDDGAASLQVSQDVVRHGNLCVKVDAGGNLVIYQPAGGQLAPPGAQLNKLPSLQTVQMLPKGSLLLLDPDQLEAMLYSFSLQNKQLQQALQAAQTKTAQTDDLTKAMTQWASAHGFPAGDVNTKVQQWANEVQQGRVQADDMKKGLAALALRDYKTAAQYFNKAADDVGQSMDAEDKELAAILEKRRQQLRTFVDTKYQAANADQLRLQFHAATQDIQQASDRAQKELAVSPQDAANRTIALEARLRLANAQRDEAAVSDPGVSGPLLAKAIANYGDLLNQFSAPDDQGDWASTENNLCIAQGDAEERGSSADVHQDFDNAVKACEAAQTVYTSAKFPGEWAESQVNLGKADRLVRGRTEQRSPGSSALSAGDQSLPICAGRAQDNK
jgi:tetratricopeptide (TPR) repeat protein